MAAALENDRMHLLALAKYTKSRQCELSATRESRHAAIQALRDTQQKTGECLFMLSGKSDWAMQLGFRYPLFL